MDGVRPRIPSGPGPFRLGDDDEDQFRQANEFHNNGTRPPPRAMVDDKKAALARLKASRQSRRAECGAPEWNATPEPTAAARCASPSVRAGVPTAAHNLNSLLIQPTPLLQAQAEALGGDVAQG